MLNLMANMVSHIKRVARPNKPFQITSKYSEEVSSLFPPRGWDALPFLSLSFPLSRSRALSLYLRSISFSFKRTSPPLSHPLRDYGDYERRVWSPIEATTSKARTRALAAMSAITEARFTQLFTVVIFVSRCTHLFPPLRPTNVQNCQGGSSFSARGGKSRAA
jgi:hypothetical protein